MRSLSPSGGTVVSSLFISYEESQSKWWYCGRLFINYEESQSKWWYCGIYFRKRKTLTWRKPYLRKLDFLQFYEMCTFSPNLHKMCIFSEKNHFQWEVTFSFKNLMEVVKGLSLGIRIFLRKCAHFHAFRKTLPALGNFLVYLFYWSLVKRKTLLVYEAKSEKLVCAFTLYGWLRLIRHTLNLARIKRSQL